MLFNKIYIGYPESHDNNLVIDFLKKHDIMFVGNGKKSDGLQFLNVETYNLRERCLLCFGNYSRLQIEEKIDHLKTMWQLTEDDEIIKSYRFYEERGRWLLLQDAEFWVSFITDFVNTFDKIAIYGTHPTIKRELIKNEISLEDFNQYTLFKLRLDQMLIVYKC